MTHDLRIVPAGAGAGKTHHIKTTLLDWVEQGLVRPDRILAVTFTEAGAGELRQRIRASLIAAGRMEDALAVDQAYVSTIHGLGLRLMTEHAFSAGASPAPRLLSDAERDLLIRQELARVEILHPIAADLKRHGYADGYGTTAADAFRGQVLALVTLLAHLGPRGLSPDLATQAVQMVRDTYGPVSGTGKVLGDRLHKAVLALLKAFPQNIATADMKNTPQEEFRGNFRNLAQAQDRPRLDYDWPLWVNLTSLRLSKRGCPTPPGYDDLAQAVMDAASAVATHPGPLEAACTLLRALIGGAQEILARYARHKRELGVIDFSDMVVDAARLLREDERVRAAILDEIDCVIVDEFQDTNPVQFDLLWSLARGAPRTILVGDVKQAIMGFQGADARLMEAIAAAFSRKVTPLDRNWRSDPRIMDFVNAVSAHFFGKAYDPLAPTRKNSPGSALEVVETEASRRGRTDVRPHHHLTAHLSAMLARKDAHVVDRHSGKKRTLLPSDIAVLCPTNSMCGRYAEALRDLGLPVQVNGGGWWNSPIVQAACHALQVADDPQDLHAALCFTVLGPPRLSLQTALKQILETGTLIHPALEALRALGHEAPRLTVPALLARTIAAGALRDFAQMQDDPAQGRADLLKLEAEADEFLATHRDMRAAAGFHGFGARVFLGWLASRGDEKGFDQHPNPSGAAANGIEVLTWHASKGREWPVVAVAGLDNEAAPRPNSLSSICTEFSDLNALLDHMDLRFSPAFAAPEAWARFEEASAPDAEATARRLLYVALTRARDTLVLEWPVRAAQKAADEDGFNFSGVQLLVREAGMKLDAKGHICIGNKTFPARISHCGTDMPPEFDEVRESDPILLPRLGRRAVMPHSMRDDGGPGLILPSGLELPLHPMPEHVDIVNLAMPVVWDEATFTSPAARGDALHAALQVLLARPDLAPRLPERLGLTEDTVTMMHRQVTALKDWLNARGYDRFMTEVPIDLALENGAHVSAALDLVAHGPAGLAVLDHKSATPTDAQSGFTAFWPQLSAYVASLRAMQGEETPVLAAINWVKAGQVSFVKMSG